MPLGLQCAPWKWKFVLLNWCGCEGLLGRKSRLGGRSLISRIFRVSPGFHAQRRPQSAFVSAQVEAHAADVAIGISAPQAGAEHSIHRAANLGLDQGLVHRQYRRQRRHAEFGHVQVNVCAAGLPERNALSQCQRAKRQTGLQQAPPRGAGPNPAARAEEGLLSGHDPAPREMPGAYPLTAFGKWATNY